MNGCTHIEKFKRRVGSSFTVRKSAATLYSFLNSFVTKALNKASLKLNLKPYSHDIINSYTIAIDLQYAVPSFLDDKQQLVYIPKLERYFNVWHYGIAIEEFNS